MNKKKKVAPVEVAAAIYGCEVEELMGWHEFEDGGVAIIAPTGQKFVYPAERMLEERGKVENLASKDSSETRKHEFRETREAGTTAWVDGGPELDCVPEQVSGAEEVGLDEGEDSNTDAFKEATEPTLSQEGGEDEALERGKPGGKKNRR